MTSQTLFEKTLERTADRLVRELPAKAGHGATVEIWLFEGLARRRAMQAELARHGITARIFCAYKPLVHYFLEDIDRKALVSARIVFPRHAACAENRFLLEAYPLAALFPDTAIEFVQADDAARDGLGQGTPTDRGVTAPGCTYRVGLQYEDRHEEHAVFAPNVLKNDFLGRPVFTPSAWMNISRGDQVSSAAISADYEQAYEAVMSTVTAHDWGGTEPYFGRLTVSMSLPGVEQALACGQEAISTTEAMHEDIYFSILEYFQHYSGREPGSRGLQPGQIIPDIRLDNESGPRVVVAFTRAAADEPPACPLTTLDKKTIAEDGTPLPSVQGPLRPAQIEKHLQGFSGRHFVFASRQNRAVNGVYMQGSLPAVLISGAQHANETSGVVGALRAAEQLKTRAGAHFVLMPLENPDGYALHQALCATNPTHMHHAARYTALGDDLEYRERAPWFERAARNHAFEISNAQLHLNLHGYPAHEWTRPCSGYLPRGFEMWSIPKGFFLILRYRESWRDTALALLEHVTRDLSTNHRLLQYNTEQLQRYHRHSGTMPFQVQNGMPYTTATAPGQTPGVTLITEFPDETVYGDEFIFAHSVQQQTVLSACHWWWNNMPNHSV